MLTTDEISFMDKIELNDLDIRMRDLGDNCVAFGGFSVIFAGDLCQFEPVQTKEEHLLFSTQSGTRFGKNMNTVIILSNNIPSNLMLNGENC